MNIPKFIFLLFLPLIGLVSCEKNKSIDTEKPGIRADFAEAFPLNCDTLYFGETFIFNAKFEDNVELGSFSIDIHNNFDHHSHSTEVSECIFNPAKEPENPFVFTQDYNLPEGVSNYTTNLAIELPSQNNVGKFDEGDYHFFISLTDHEGWSVQMGLSIKMIYRE